MSIFNYDKTKFIKSSTFIGVISNIIGKYKNKDDSNPIRHYINKYNNVPVWVLSSYLTFGQTVSFYKLFDKKLKNNINKRFSKILEENIEKKTFLNIEVVESYLDNISKTRNIVAHNSRILNYRFRKHCKYLENLHLLHKINAEDPKADIYNVMLIFQCSLSKEQYIQFHNSICKVIRKKLKSKFKNREKYVENILSSMGIPLDLKTIKQNNKTD